MAKKEFIISAVSAVLITAIFFYKTLFWGLAPFPGDLLIAEYKPWRSSSFLGYNPGSYPHKAQYPDTLRQLYPWKTLVVDSLKQGKLPLWNPYNFSGTPLLANFQSAVFYPLTLFYLTLPQPIAWTILVILQPLLACLFMYLYCRRIKLSSFGSWLAALSFSFGSYMSVWLEYNTIGQVILWLPLALLAVEERRLHLLIISLSMTLLAGHPQIATYLIVFTLIYVWFRLPQKLAVRFILLSLLLPIGIAAVQLLPGIELMLNSARSAHPYDFFIQKILIQPWQLIMVVFPDFFGNPATRTYWPSDTYVGKVLSIGLVPLFFLLATKRSNHPLKRFYAATAIGILLLITVNPLSLLLYLLPIPIIRSSSPTLVTFLFQFSLAILAGIGLDWWQIEHHTIKKLFRRSLQVFAILTLSVVGVFILAQLNLPWSTNILQGHKAILYAAVISLITLFLFFIAIKWATFRRHALILVLVIGGLDLFYSFYKFNPFVPKELFYPPTEIVTHLKKYAPGRIWGYGNAAIEANFATQVGLYSPDGYDPLYPAWYGEFIELSKNGVFPLTFTTSTRSDATIVVGYGQLDLLQNSYRLRLLERLNVETILDRTENQSTDQTFPADLFSLLFEVDDWKAYKLKTAVPRAVLASTFTLATTREQFVSRYFDPSFDPRREVILQDSPLLPPSDFDQEAVAQISRIAPERVKITTSARAPKLLVLSDTYYPGWKAMVDGAQTPIYKANYTMRAIEVPAGNHTIEFIYAPGWVRVGIWISFLSLGVLVFVCLRRYSRDIS